MPNTSPKYCRLQLWHAYCLYVCSTLCSAIYIKCIVEIIICLYVQMEVIQGQETLEGATLANNS